MSPKADTKAIDNETEDWLAALDALIKEKGQDSAIQLVTALHNRAYGTTADQLFTANTPYVNTIPREDQLPFPGNREIERIIKSIVRWNAMAMVVQANRELDGIGGHISTYASSATLYEVGFNHFFRAKSKDYGGDQIYFQGHASPGIYARAFVEGRITEKHLKNFRRELASGGGLPSYPHPRLMPDFWQFPTVSMGLGPIMAIYQARFNRYMEHRGIKPPNGGKVWAFVGDGETDEPETLGAIGLAVREKLDNLIFVVNCNLQRLDGPVRGNGKIIQELERVFRGAGWNVLKVIWGSDWDPIFEKDQDGALRRVLGNMVDGEYQKFTVESAQYIRDRIGADDPRAAALLESVSDGQLKKIRRGGHDPDKVYAAYAAAMKNEGSPTVILAKTVKGYGLGEMGEGKNVTHQQKKLNEDELREFRARFGIPISDESVAYAPFYKPAVESASIKYLHERREALGGFLPNRKLDAKPVKAPKESLFKEFLAGHDRPVSTTMVFVRILSKLLREKNIGKRIVPIVPDEARTFGMDGLFRQVGIYASTGQLYNPVDADNLLYYKEAVDGQIIEEGLSESGSQSSFIAAGTAYATHGINMIPFYIFYSMFGFQRVGDLIWAAADVRARGFLLGATAGRTTLNGEGLQHQDGHSLLLAETVPTVRAYDPSFAFELAEIIKDGMYRMFEKEEDLIYYITVENENYPMPAAPKGKAVKQGILKGMYKFSGSKSPKRKRKAQLLGSGAIMNEVLKAKEILEDQFDVATEVWSVTSYGELRRNGLETERWNLLHPRSKQRVPYVAQCLNDAESVTVASSDYMKALPDSISKWAVSGIESLGTDGFGRSDSREALREYFEVDARFIALATLKALAKKGKMSTEEVNSAMKSLKISARKPNPMKI